MNTKIKLGIELWELAEEFNRENYVEEAYGLKAIFVDFLKQQSEEDKKEIEEYLQSIGG